MASRQRKGQIALVRDPAVRVLSEGEALQQEIAELRELDLGGLRLRWRNLFCRAAPVHLPKFLLLRIVAYRMQANVHGDICKKARLTLERFARDAKEQGGSQAAKFGPAADVVRLRTGTLLMREWGGVMQRVTVLDDGFMWEGATYPSLSKVAQAITGTRWNGPRFFGLRDKSPTLRPDADSDGVAVASALAATEARP